MTLPPNERTLARLRELERHVQNYGTLTRPEVAKKLRISRSAALRLIQTAETYSRLTVDTAWVDGYQQYRVSA